MKPKNMKLKHILSILFCLPTLTWAQGSRYQANVAKPTADIFGELPVCLGPTNVQAVTCGSDGCVCISPAKTTATFAALDATSHSAIGASYSSAVDLPDDTKVVILDNQTNGDVMVSMDGGTSDTFHIKAGDVLTIPLSQAGLSTTADVRVKDGTIGSTSGTFYVYSYK